MIFYVSLKIWNVCLQEAFLEVTAAVVHLHFLTWSLIDFSVFSVWRNNKCWGGKLKPNKRLWVSKVFFILFNEPLKRDQIETEQGLWRPDNKGQSKRNPQRLKHNVCNSSSNKTLAIYSSKPQKNLLLLPRSAHRESMFHSSCVHTQVRWLLHIEQRRLSHISNLYV